MIDLIESGSGYSVFKLRDSFFKSRCDQLLAIADMLSTLLRFGKKIVKSGRGSGSLEGEGTAGLDYTVVTGDVILKKLPWLYSIYTDPRVISAFSDAAGSLLFPSRHIESSININLLFGAGKRYERHLDGGGWSSVFMVSDLGPLDGGELALHTGGGKPVLFDSAFGKIVLFDAEHVPHEVMPLKTDKRRITVPMAYLSPGGNERPEGLDDYLYK